MQPLARDGFTDAEITALLTGGRLEVTPGLEVLNADLTLNTDYGDDGDISDDFLAGSVSRTMGARIHGACRIDVSVALRWGIDLVRPYMILSDGIVTARFDAGVYMLTTPETPVGVTPATYGTQGVDRVYLLDREVGSDYQVTANGSYTYGAALAQAFTDAGLTGVLIDGDAYDYVVPATRSWPLVASSTDPDQTDTPVTWLRIVNDLSTAINFRGVWADQSGLLRCQRYISPTDRAPEFVFDADDGAITIVDEDRVLRRDEWRTPNRWVFLWSNRPGGMQSVEGDGMYTYNLPDSDPRSALSRGLVWPRTHKYEAASQPILQNLGDRRVEHDRRVVTQLAVRTGPFPVASHFDVFTYKDAAAGGTFKVQATEWEYDLAGGNVEWTWETI